MADTATLEMDGDRQIVRLPKAFHLPGHQVRVSRSGQTLVLAPIQATMSREEVLAVLDQLGRREGVPRNRVSPPSIEQMRAGLARLEQFKDVPIMENDREQPPMPDDDDLPSLDT